MSQKSWRTKFYPVSALYITCKTDDDIVLVEHSLKKWQGALPENLKAHKLETSPFEYNADSCSLCTKHYRDMKCNECPLFEHLGHRCDEGSDPYHEYTSHNDPLPMIEALEQTLEGLRRRKGEIHVFEDTLSAPPADEEFPY